MPNIKDKAKKIKLLLMDCDGVLTDGRLYFTERGEAMKVFHVRDGQGLVMWHNAGFKSGIISGRDASQIIEKRASELGVSFVRTKSADKTKDFHEIIAEANVSAEEVAFIGDDIGDIEVMKLVGLPIAVADAVEENKAAAAHVTNAKGGLGAVREVTNLLLRAKQD